MTIGCEMRKCRFLKNGKCTDEEEVYENICRYNDFWETEEGKEEFEQYEGGIPNE